MDELIPSPHFLQNFMNPKAIAFYGANEKIPENMGAFQLLTMIDNGYKGKIYPIHPHLDSIFGFPAYKSIKDVPDQVDLVEIILSKNYIFPILEEIGQKGIKNVIIVTAGFREQNNFKEQEQLVSIAKKYGMHILGPNCIGILNTHTYFSQNSADTCILNTTVQSYGELPGNVSIISQSGTFVSHVFMLLPDRHLGLSKTFSVGNEADMDICDCLEYLEDDPTTQVILLYIEETKRGTRFFDLVKRINPHKPVIVLYAGGSEGGARAVSSHTGALGGNDQIFNAMVAQTGIVRVMTLEELIDTATLFATFIPLNVIPKGNRVAVVTNSGGPGAMMCDHLTRNGIALPHFSSELIEKIQKFMPPTAQIDNPLDYTFALNPVHFYQAVPRLIAKSGEVDAMIVYGALGAKFFRFQGYGDKFMHLPENQVKLQNWIDLSESSIDAAARLMKKHSFPIINVNFLGIQEPMVVYLQSHGFPTFQMPSAASKALEYYLKYYTYHRSHKID